MKKRTGKKEKQIVYIFSRYPWLYGSAIADWVGVKPWKVYAVLRKHGISLKKLRNNEIDPLDLKE